MNPHIEATKEKTGTAMKTRSILLAVMALAGATAVAEAQAPYPMQYPNYQAPAPIPTTPPTWSYDPYTSGLTACPQSNWGNSPQCRETLVPTYGQPNYSPPR